MFLSLVKSGMAPLRDRPRGQRARVRRNRRVKGWRSLVTLQVR